MPASEKLMPAGTSSASISMVIPAWREGENLLALIREASAWPEIAEIIVSAAGISPEGSKLIERAGAHCVKADLPNRGKQMNLGAAVANAEWVLFQHADTVLTRLHVKSLAALSDAGDVVGGAFYRKFDERHPHCRWLEPIERWHNRTCGALYGDQSIFVRKTHFLGLGGFAEFPLMEDVEFSRRLRRSGNLAMLDPPLASSPRKHLACGAWKTTVMNAWLILLYKAGISPTRLHAWYYSPGSS